VVPLYRTDPVKTSLFPTDRAERDPITGMAVSIGFTPIRGKGIQIREGMGEQFKPLTHDRRIPVTDIQQGELSTLDADTVDGKHAADFAPAFHTHPLTHITQSGALENQVPKWNATSSVWQPGFVEWNEVTNKPTTFPPSPHTHSLNDIQQSGAQANQVLKWTGAAWTPGNVAWNEVENKPTTFPPSPHTHSLEDLEQSGAETNQVPKWTGTRWQAGNVDWDEVTNKPDTFPPAPHTHDANDIATGRLSASRLPTSDIANRFLVVRTANADAVYDVIQVDDLPEHTHTRSQITDFAHASSHVSGGSDAITGNLDANARVNVQQGGTSVGTRRSINFIAGTNVSLDVVDDEANEKVDVTINAQNEPFVTATAPPQVIAAGLYVVLARITVPTAKPNLKVVAVAVSPFLSDGATENAWIELFNETDNVSVATWESGDGPVYLEPNQVFDLGGKTISFRLSHGASVAQECWGSVSFKLTT